MLTSYWQHFKSGTDIRGVALDGVETARYFAGLQADELIDILCEA